MGKAVHTSSAHFESEQASLVMSAPAHSTGASDKLMVASHLQHCNQIAAVISGNVNFDSLLSSSL